VVGNAELSSKIMDGFQKNQLRALIIGYRGYKCRRFIEICAFLARIWHFVILVSENLQLFLWEELFDKILGNNLNTWQNFVPARKAPIFLYLLKSQFRVFGLVCNLIWNP